VADRRDARSAPLPERVERLARATEGVDVSDSLRARIERRRRSSGRAEAPRAAEPPPRRPSPPRRTASPQRRNASPQRRRSPERKPPPRPAIPPSPLTDEEDDVPQSTRDRVAALAERAKERARDASREARGPRGDLTLAAIDALTRQY